MKLIKLIQARIEGDSEPKVLSVGECYVDVEFISLIHMSTDKYDVPIRGVTGILLKNGNGIFVYGELKEIAEQIEEILV